MLYEEFKETIGETQSIQDRIKNLHKLPKEYKEIALTLITPLTHAKNGIVSELSLHPELIKKIKEGGYPDGYSMGVDKNGFFIHTHRARSKSHETPSDITVDEMKRTAASG